jgi:2-dehydro-3-deoxyphosphooctonate aldolase (KDO 8-P synthase)
MNPNSTVKLGDVEIGNAKKLTIIAGPCQLESRGHAFDMAGALAWG